MIDINLSILLAQIITFIVALFIIWKISWKPLTGMMRQRSEKIRSDIETANNERAAAEGLRQSYERHIADLKSEANKVISAAAKDGERERQSIVDTARREAEKLKENTKRELQKEKERIVQELRSEVAGLAVQISEKLIKKTIDPAVQAKVLKDILDNLDSLN